MEFFIVKNKEWIVYSVKIDDFNSVVRLDLNAKSNYYNQYPVCLYLKLNVLHTNENGFPIPEELQRLQNIEGSISEKINKLGIIPVVITSTEKKREIIIFTSKEDMNKLIEIVNNIIAETEISGENYEFSVPGEDDWAWYNFIYPDKLTIQIFQTEQLISYRKSMGDIVEIPRPVDHVAYFKSEKDRAEFLESVLKEGFKLSNNLNSVSGVFGVEFQRADKTSEEEMKKIVRQLYYLADHHQGEYDSWGAVIEIENK